MVAIMGKRKADTPISTKIFLDEVKTIFERLGYAVKAGQINLDSFYKAAFDTLNHIGDFDTAIDAVKKFRYAVKNFSEIRRAIADNADYWNKIIANAKNDSELLSDEEAGRMFCLTNAIDKSMYLSGQIFKHPAFGPDKNVYFKMKDEGGHCFRIIEDEDPFYYLRFVKGKNLALWLLNEKKEKIAKISMGVDFELIVGNNKTGYFIRNNTERSTFSIYKDDKRKLSDKELDDYRNVSAGVVWDMIDNDDGDYSSFAHMNVIQNTDDIDLFYMFVAACMLLFKAMMERYQKEKRGENLGSLFWFAPLLGKDRNR